MIDELPEPTRKIMSLWDAMMADFAEIDDQEPLCAILAVELAIDPELAQYVLESIDENMSPEGAFLAGVKLRGKLDAAEELRKAVG